MDPQTTPEEFDTNIREMFKAADINNSEALDLNEFEKFGEMFMDSVKDMKLFDKDFNLQKIFETFDKNGDGMLDWDEIWQKVLPISTRMKAKSY